MRGRRRLALSLRCLGVLQLLLPWRYRRRHGAESLATFALLARDAFGRGGTLMLVRTLLSAWLDLIRRLPLEHAAARRARWSAAAEYYESGVGTEGRAGRQEGVMAGMAEDVRYALRRVRREPGFFTFAALIIGLGIGANAAVFSVMSPLLLRPLPFRDPERLVWVAQSRGGGLSAVTLRTSNLRDYRELNRSFESLTGYFAFFDYGSYTLIDAGEPQRLVGLGIAQDFLDVLGVQPQLGRGFVDEESVWQGRPAAILTHEFWVRRFAAKPDIVGRSITLNGTPTEVVGVLPATFDFASTFTPASHVDFLTPFPISDETDRWGNTLAIIGRLRPGITLASAQADLDRINEQLRRNDPNRWGLGAVVTGLREHIAGEYRPAMLLLVAAACGVLLVACANLSNLLLARGRGRGKEMAVRSTLGANRLRLLRQLSIESLILALAGGIVGVSIAWGVTTAIARTNAVSIPLLRTVSVDGTVLVFATAVTLLAGFLVGIAPVLQVVTGREAAAMRDASRGSTEGRRSAAIRDVLVVSEVAAACVLLVGSGLLMRSFMSVLDVDLGFEPAGAVAWRVDTTLQFDSASAFAAYYDNLVARVKALPGVEDAGLTDTPPLGRNRGWGIAAKGVVYENNRRPGAFPRIVDSGYLQTMRIPLVAGRFFTQFDDAKSGNVVILNRTAADNLFPGQDPIGRTVIINGGPEYEVVGVVSDVRHQALEQQAGNEMYLPYAQSWDGITAFTLMVRSALPLPTLARSVRTVLHQVDPGMPAEDFEKLEAVVDHAVSPRRFVLMILAGFAGTALLLAALGIYAVLSYSVSQRVPEIGIRMALGESAMRVRWRVVGRTMMLAGMGVVIGAAVSFAVSRLIQSMLFGVQPADPVTFAGMAAILLLVSALAGFLPARRASSTDPLVALRSS
jgi:predicted permease